VTTSTEPTELVPDLLDQIARLHERIRSIAEERDRAVAEVGRLATERNAVCDVLAKAGTPGHGETLPGRVGYLVDDVQRLRRERDEVSAEVLTLHVIRLNEEKKSR
jgi:seryl-tRNA synthetase